MAVIEGKHVVGSKIGELLDLDERDLVYQFSEPMDLKRPKDIGILRSMMETAESAGAPYLLTLLENGYYAGKAVLWKENKALRCKNCGGYLNARPERRRGCLTHKKVGKSCVAQNLHISPGTA